MSTHHDHHGHDHDDDHGHDHVDEDRHRHGPGHGHAPTDFGRAFAVAAVLNIVLVAAQVAYGIVAHSMALLADAGHNFGDVLGLLLAWGAHSLAQHQPTKRYTYGFRSASILAALLNSLILLVATGAIVWEAIRRLIEPGEVAGATVMIVAALGIAVNGFSAALLLRGRKGDLNIHSAFLHLMGDAAVSIGVVAAGAIIYFTNWFWVDPAASLMVSALIVWGTWRLLHESLRMSLGAVPENIDRAQVQDCLRALPGVTEVHDLHIWAMSTTETALTAHLVRPGAHLDDGFLSNAEDRLARSFGIRHATLQIEAGDRTCHLAPDHVV
jgi:cobalt-zinc-cadmium efflux system protein